MGVYRDVCIYTRTYITPPLVYKDPRHCTSMTRTMTSARQSLAIARSQTPGTRHAYPVARTAVFRGPTLAWLLTPYTCLFCLLAPLFVPLFLIIQEPEWKLAQGIFFGVCVWFLLVRLVPRDKLAVLSWSPRALVLYQAMFDASRVGLLGYAHTPLLFLLVPSYSLVFLLVMVLLLLSMPIGVPCLVWLVTRTPTKQETNACLCFVTTTLCYITLVSVLTPSMFRPSLVLQNATPPLWVRIAWPINLLVFQLAQICAYFPRTRFWVSLLECLFILCFLFLYYGLVSTFSI